jgi:hypothetical protein
MGCWAVALPKVAQSVAAASAAKVLVLSMFVSPS